MNARVLSLLVCLCCAVGSSRAVESAFDVLRASGINGGVVVHVGCGYGRDTVQLGQAGRWMVCGLDRDPDAVQAAKARRVGAGLSGPASVLLWGGGPRPFIDNTVNLTILEDRAGVDIEECKRALCPGGRVYFKDEGMEVVPGPFGPGTESEPAVTRSVPCGGLITPPPFGTAFPITGRH